MYQPVKCFWVELTDPARARHRLRRYTRHSSGWTCEEGWHQAAVVVGEVEPVRSDRDGERPAYWGDRTPDGPTPHDDPRWPRTCEKCSYEFQPDDEWQDDVDLLYRRVDTGETMPLRDMPPGAMWNAWWLPDSWAGPDGMRIVAKCPNGHEWVIDGRASNCTLPNDSEHKCWCRHGTPPDLTVDKRPEPGERTCAAGGGSIVAGDYHGFLTRGVFSAG